MTDRKTGRLVGASTPPDQRNLVIENIANQDEESKQTFLEKHGPAMIANGFAIVPIADGRKASYFKMWTGIAFTADVFPEARQRGHSGVAIKGRDTPGVDIDSYDKAAVDTLIGRIKKRIGGAPIRYGQAPKALLMFKTDQSIKKMSSRKYRCENGKEQRVEILGDGQLYVAYGIHPKTGKPYIWDDTDWEYAEPTQIPREDLSSLSADQAHWIIDQFEQIAEERGWTEIQAGSKNADAAAASDPLVSITPKLDVSLAEAERALALLSPNMSRDAWLRVAGAMHHQFDGSEDAFSVFDHWSAGGATYVYKNARSLWNSLGDYCDRPSSFATIRRWLEIGENTVNGEPADWERVADGGEPPVEEFDDLPNEAVDEAPAKYPRLEIHSFAEFEGKTPPKVDFLVPEFSAFPRGKVSLFSGMGGLGKSTLMLQFMYARASGFKWLGFDVPRGRTLYVSCEDDEGDIHLRADRMAAAFEVPLSSAADAKFIDLVGGPTELCGPDAKRQIVATPLYHQVVDAVRRCGADTLILDGASHMFAGNEIVKVEVRQFIDLLTRVARDMRIAVVLLFHPSKSGIAEGSGKSGSEAWHNSVRHRVYYAPGKRPDGKDCDETRTLTVMKSNFGPTGQQIALRNELGLFTREECLEGAQLEASADHYLLQTIAEDAKKNRYHTPSSAAGYAPKALAKRDARFSKAALEQSMNRLIDRGALVIEDHGPPSKRTKRLRVDDQNDSARAMLSDDFGGVTDEI